MKSFPVITLIALFGFALCRPDDKYVSKYENVNVDEILKSDRLLNNYFNCLMTGDACTPDGKELKDTLPDAIQTGCSKCTDKQKMNAKTVLTFLIDNKPEQYKQLEAKYDPEGTYKKQYKAQLADLGIKE